VEGFPPKDQLKTVYVEHDIDHEAAELWPVEFIYTDPTFEGMPKEEVRTRTLRALCVVGAAAPSRTRTCAVAACCCSSASNMPPVSATRRAARLLHVSSSHTHTHTQIEGQLRDVGFTDELLRKGVAALSGGWKMKLALARAMLQKADILLLDEPTNHLDVHNVAWVKVRAWAPVPTDRSHFVTQTVHNVAGWNSESTLKYDSQRLLYLD